MGLFGGKKKTTTQTTVDRTVATKIVKLTYLQSLALSGGLATAGELSGETTGSTTTSDGKHSTNKNFISKLNDKIQNPVVAILSQGALNISSAITNALFGKKTTRDVSVTVKDSGWSLVRTWAQPQFDIIRYAIGIKELTASQFTYENVSEVVSKPWASPKEIIKVHILVDQFIPPQFPPGVFIEYYIKPDTKDSNWVRINPIDLPSQFNEDGTLIPRIISFNTERPVGSRLEEAYVNTTEPVKSVRFRAILKRPDDMESYSPILKSYRMLLTPKGGL
jgi:hypothetical protein